MTTANGPATHDNGPAHPAQAPSGTGTRAPVHLVLTGGPCAGKSTALSHLREKLTSYGWRVLVVPEAATTLITSGLHDIAHIAGTRPAVFAEVQVAITAAQLGLRASYDTLARALMNPELAPGMGPKSTSEWGGPVAEKVVIIHDRGIADNAAYVPASTYESAIAAHGLDRAGVHDLYDAVLHLRSAAVAADAYDAGGYTTENNAARHESAEEAAALDAATLEAWAEHPHVHVVSSNADFAAKLDRTLAAARMILGDPDPVEIERKFLLTQGPDLGHPSLRTATRARIVQTYLGEAGGPEQRVRSRTVDGITTYVHTTKTDVSAVRRVEVEHPITAETYRLLVGLQTPGTRTVHKDRYVFFDGDHRFELDHFIEPDAGWLCEVELVEDGDVVAAPTFLGPTTEVTDDPTWRNRSLAQIPPHLR